MSHSAAKAALLQRVALVIAPQNVLAGNELGVLLAEHGQLAESEKVFRQCLAVDPRPETWRNLSVITARMGDEKASRDALAASESLAERIKRTSHANGAAPDESANAENNSRKNQKQKSRFLASLEIPKFRNPFRR
jgi:Tfp pilus assembly protein PilF